MPNHCETDFTITGPQLEVEAFLAKHVTPTGELDCDSVTPYPQRFKDMDAVSEEWHKTYFLDEYGITPKPEYVGVRIPARPTDGFNAGGYEWCCENWGTKWGTYSGEGITTFALKDGRMKAELSFQSAWSPPQPVFEAIIQMYPTLAFRAESFERGMAYRRLYKWKNGKQIAKCEFVYNGRRGG